jgi:hypothetical protein
MAELCLLGLDSGSTATKAVVFDLAGRVCGTGRRRAATLAPQPGRVERDMAACWEGAAEAIRAALADAGIGGDRIGAVGVTAHGDGLYLLGRDHRPLGHGITSLDDRAGGLVRAWHAAGVLDRALLDAAGPVGGAAQALTYAPGVAINSYSTSGAGKSIITINGVNQGWSGLNGNAQDGAVGVTFDGIPIADPVTGLWQAPTIPFLAMIGSTSVAYGPGNPDQRWYDSLAGTVGFNPLQPTAKPGGDIAMTYGSFNQKSVTFDARTGLYDGWSTILAGGFGNGNSYRQGNGFNNPDSDDAVFLKTRHDFTNGALSFGAYDVRSQAFRPTYIPQSANPAITINGLNAQGEPNPGPLYSQATSGFYGSPPFATYDKNDSNAMVLLYAKQTLDLGGGTTLHNQAWYMHISAPTRASPITGPRDPRRIACCNPTPTRSATSSGSPMISAGTR